MKLNLITLAALLCAAPAALAQTVPPTMNFQGRLAKPDGTSVADGTYNVTFGIYAAPSGGSPLWTQTVSGAAVHNGAFGVLLNYYSGFQNGATLASVFGGNPVYLDIRINGGASLTPRQAFASNAYAFTANTANTALNVTGASIASGTIPASAFAPNIFNPIAWLLGGNSGTNGTQFLGTTDNQPLIFKVNGHQAMRYSYAENTADPNPVNQYRSVNVLGGSEINTIAVGVVGATIAGGGEDFFADTDFPNKVTADFGTISGGADNTASGGYSIVAGGGFNTASGGYSFVAGGAVNTASGLVSFAAGQQAQANHNGAFVWNDYSNSTSFASTGVNQFLIHASGGVGIGTNAPGTQLDVAGGLTLDHNFAGAGTLDANTLRFGANSGEGIGSKRTAGGNSNGLDFYTSYTYRMSITQSGNVGIGTTAPQQALSVVGGLVVDQGSSNGGQLDKGGPTSYGLTFGSNSGEGLASNRTTGTNQYGLDLYTGATDRISITNGGLVGIGTTNPAYKLDVNGSLHCIGFTNSSDARYKTNVATLNNALENVLNLRGVSYDWDKAKWPAKDFPEGGQVGFIAQEVEKVFPDLVQTDRDGYKSVNYIGVVPVLVEAVKTLKHDNDDKQKQVDKLKAQLKEIDALEKQVAENADLKKTLATILARLEKLERASEASK